MNLSAGALAQSTSVPPAGRIWTNTSCLSGFTSASPTFASSDLSLSRVVAPRGRRSPRVTVIVNACDCMQQAGSSKSVSPLPSSSMQLPQISRGGGTGPVPSVEVVVEVVPGVVVVVGAGVVPEVVVGPPAIVVEVVDDAGVVVVDATGALVEVVVLTGVLEVVVGPPAIVVEVVDDAGVVVVDAPGALVEVVVLTGVLEVVVGPPAIVVEVVDDAGVVVVDAPGALVEVVVLTGVLEVVVDVAPGVVVVVEAGVVLEVVVGPPAIVVEVVDDAGVVEGGAAGARGEVGVLTGVVEVAPGVVVVVGAGVVLEVVVGPPAIVVEVVDDAGVVVVVDATGALVDVVVLTGVLEVVVVRGAAVVVVVVATGQPALKIRDLHEAWSFPCFTSSLVTWAAQLTYAPWLRAGQHWACAAASASGTPRPLHAAAKPRSEAPRRTARARKPASPIRVPMKSPIRGVGGASFVSPGSWRAVRRGCSYARMRSDATSPRTPSARPVFPSPSCWSPRGRSRWYRSPCRVTSSAGSPTSCRRRCGGRRRMTTAAT